MSKIRLHTWDVRTGLGRSGNGAALPIRLMLNHMWDTPFDEVHYSLPEELQKADISLIDIERKLPKGEGLRMSERNNTQLTAASVSYLPVLEIDGRTISGTVPIMTYLGAKYGYVAQSQDDEKRVQLLVQIYQELNREFAKLAFAKSSKYNKREKTFLNSVWLTASAQLEQIVMDSDYFCASATFADFLMIDILYHIASKFAIKRSAPKIFAWLEKMRRKESVARSIMQHPEWFKGLFPPWSNLGD